MTSHQAEANEHMLSFNPTNRSKQRANYENYVMEELLKRYDRDVHYPSPRPIGTIITIPATNFDDHFVLPLTISQAHKQRCIDQQ